MLQDNVNKEMSSRRRVIEKLRVINDDKHPGKYVLINRRNKLFLINKHEQKKDLYKRNDIVFVWVTKDHESFGYVKYTIDGTPIIEKIRSLSRFTLDEINEMLYGEYEQDLKHLLTDVMDEDLYIAKSIKIGSIRNFHKDLKNLELSFVKTSNMIVKHYILVMNYLYKKFHNKENVIMR